MQPSDAELLIRWRGGDVVAGEVLFERYYPPLERFFVNKVSVGIGDLVQETLRKFVAGSEHLRDGDKLRSYLFSIAYTTLYSHLRAQRPAHESVDVDTVTIADALPGPSAALARKRELRLLLEGLRGIPISDQVILELHYWEGLATADIAEVLGCPRNTAKSRLRRAQQRLRHMLTEISTSATLLRSTLSDLDDWAEACRDRYVGAA
ncbi:RNA polymerase sigma factor [Haliangium ochraceum]|uniref:RNA polymerase, sigma-24 subunit, ECF subfamily n=1 Tax=Haliangium ochraceum (strain DSM 14365 / JCM 11303 / SMP-2) TaxID=502025 RepID=D0LTC4_HALO1|nr:sigma-70 family RNA polymerase sigma factor [Haliangium ochraceum]ACY13819.1 RNA polymerase, sigma-24 subunit, ECF subfamily [Haliangium ochraceum DSM 14365]